jgi:hypothetical protein
MADFVVAQSVGARHENAQSFVGDASTICDRKSDPHSSRCLVNERAKGTNSSELALDAIAKAFAEISRSDTSVSRPEDPDFKETCPVSLSTVGRDAVPPSRRSAFGKIALWGFIGVLAVVCIGALVSAWPISGARTATERAAMPPAPAPVSVAEGEKYPVTTQAIPSVATAMSVKSAEQPTVQNQIAPQPAEPRLSIPADMTPRIQALERRLINLEQGIEQTRNDQAKLARQTSDLLGGLTEAQQRLILRVEEFTREAKAAEEKAARDRLTAEERFRGNQEQLVKIGELLKTSQDQIEKLKSAAQRPVSKSASLPPSQHSNAQAATPKPAPKLTPRQSEASSTPSARQ